MKEDNQEGISLPKNFVIEDVNHSSSKDGILYAGKVEDWKQREFTEKEKVRPYITAAIVLAWAVSVVVIALKYFSTDNLLLFTPSALLTGPLYIILRFYYRSG